MEGFEQHGPDRRIAEMAIGLLDEQQVTILVFRAQECEIVFVSVLALALAGIRVEHAGLTDVIEREVGIGKFFFEFRTRGNQLDHALPEHQRVVAESCYVANQCRVGRHRLSTSSGIS